MSHIQTVLRTVLNSPNFDELGRDDLIATIKRLYDKLRRLQLELDAAHGRLSRKKISSEGSNKDSKSATTRVLRKTRPFINTLLTMTDREFVIIDILRIRDELQASGREKVTDNMALEVWHSRNGRGKYRAKGKGSRTLLNAISTFRTIHKRSLRNHNPLGGEVTK